MADYDTAAPLAGIPPMPRAHLSSATTKATLRIQSRLLALAREFLAREGFTEMLPPIIGPVTDPGIRGSKQVDVDYYGHRYKLMTSSILNKQASLTAFGKIFYVAPNVRLEPPETATTGRHLAEFHQLDVEVAGASRADVMSLAERLVAWTVSGVAAGMTAELDLLSRDTDAFAELSTPPYPRTQHSAAVAELIGLGYPQNPDGEIEWTGEQILSGKSSRPFFIVDYPKGSRGFYDREKAGEEGVLANFDLILPEGYGEVSSGSEREHDYRRIVSRMRETGENPAKYGWYLEMARDGIPASAGFGLGVERLTRYVAGLDAVWQASAYPKLPGVVSP